MSKKKIFIRCKAGKNDGWGNLQRQFNIAELIDKRKYKIIFFFQGSNKGYQFLKKSFLTIKLKENISLEKELKILGNFDNSDFFIIEQLNISLLAQRKYKSITKKLIIFDDLLQNQYHCNDLFCCQINNNYKLTLNNKKNKIDRFFYGYKYFPLSKELIKVSKIKNKKNKNIVISLGGGTYDKYYINILQILDKYKSKFNKVIIFLKGEFKNDTIINIKKYDFIVVKKDKSSIFKYIKESQLNILSGGYHKIESNFLRAKSFFIATHQHQNSLLENVTKFTNQNFIYFKSKNSNLLLNEYLESFFNGKKYKEKYIINNYNKNFIKLLLR